MPVELARCIVIFSPFVFLSVIAAGIASDRMKEEARRQMLLDDLTLSNYEKMMREEEKQKQRSAGIAYGFNRTYQRYGLKFRFETLVMESLLLFAAGCIAALVVYKAGFFLMLTIGAVLASFPFLRAQNKLKQAKDVLTIEFLEKMRDTSSLLSVGKTFETALAETIAQGGMSEPLQRELLRVRQNLYIHQSPSRAFSSMYARLEIDEIKTFAQTFAVYERSGGNLITVMRANDRFAMNKIELKNEQNIFVRSQSNQQKFIIGFPIGFITLMFLFVPSVFGTYYSTPAGQIAGIFCVLMLYGGVLLSGKIAAR